ncbi:DEAD/DEAH box helicase [Eubacteriaceae bacterium ES3]|nr:DEAD/DEAH box helicase [Eubacteriaceae bacterium ES3]
MSEAGRVKPIDVVRENLIRDLDASANSTELARRMADSLFAVDLTVYSRKYSFDSLVYNSFALSHLDSSISLHPDQLDIVNTIKEKDATILSAPTSFGKTFSVFEYIVREKPSNIVLIVPTLALVDEYLKRIIKKYSDKFSEYKVYINIDEEKQYDFNGKNIFILTHDKVVNERMYTKLEEIDFLVIDEVYKLKKDLDDDRVLILNLAYLRLAGKSWKYVLLAPFIGMVEDIEKLEKSPVFIRSSFSPVVNDVQTIDILNNNDRFPETLRILREHCDCQKTLVYFPTVVSMSKFVNDMLSDLDDFEEISQSIMSFIKWVEDEIHPEWYVIKALRKGFLVHNGQLPMGIRQLQMELFNNEDNYTNLLCTSTLLEGVNTTSKNVIITEPSRAGRRNGNAFTAFDFYNLVGRTGRLNKHYLGKAYYLRGPNDQDYIKSDASISIKFEITDDSIDVDIQNGNYEQHRVFIDFINELGITYEEYVENIGGSPRFSTVKYVYDNFKQKENALLDELRNLNENDTRGRFSLIRILYEIIEGKKNKLEVTLINKLINKQRLRIKGIIEAAIVNSRSYNIDYIISTVIRLKNSYIEYGFYSKVQLIKFFLEKKNVEEALIRNIEEKVLHSIEVIYFTNSKQKRMLLDLGIYDRDIQRIINVIGEDFDDAVHLKELLKENNNSLRNLSYISRYVINNIL